jgi:hypothetical protein
MVCFPGHILLFIINCKLKSYKIKKLKQKSFIILGMGRSATSLVAKGLNSIINMGDNFYPANFGNPEGYYEDMDIMALNESILQQAGGSWKNVPDHNSILEQKDKFSNKIENLINEKFSHSALWGIKDPRLTLTIDLWLPFLPNPHFISIFRNPVDVANSLIKRDGNMFIDVGETYKLAEIYNKRLLDFLIITYNKYFENYGKIS